MRVLTTWEKYGIIGVSEFQLGEKQVDYNLWLDRYIENFLAKTEQGTDSCWIWKGCRNTQGYGGVEFRGSALVHLKQR
jgi:hypothetical protein